MRFLPVSRADMEERGIDQLDFVYVIGDAYVDHPSFGPAIISRLLESPEAIRWGSLPSRICRHAESIMALGEPRLGFLVSAGNMDSMVNHYSVAKKHRKSGFLHAGRCDGKTTGSGSDRLLQPDPAEYISMCRSLRAGSRPALRRMAHYDYWSDSPAQIDSAGKRC